MKRQQALYVVLNQLNGFLRGWGEPERIEITERGITLQPNCVDGTYFSCVWDSREQEMQWHRLQIKGAGIEDIAVSVYASESKWILVEGERCLISEVLHSDRGIAEKEAILQPYLVRELDNGEDALLIGIKGRYLWLQLHLCRRGEHRPHVEQVKVEFPHRSYLRYLPEIYQPTSPDDTFLQRFLAIFQSFQQNITEQIDALPTMLEPLTTNRAFLDWLAELLGVEDADIWSEEKLRALLSRIVPLYRMRGTKQYLCELVELYTGEKPFLVEYHKVAKFHRTLANGERYSALYCVNPYEFALLIPEPKSQRDYRALERLVELSKPAEMECRLIPLKNYIFLDQHSYLGVNSRLGRYTAAKLDGFSAMPFSSLSGRTDMERKGLD